MKIGFIQARNEIDVNWFKPLAFGYLKAYLDKYTDFSADMRFIETPENFKDFDIIAISSTTQDFAVAKRIAQAAKQERKDIITILGGHHITYMPQTLSDEIDIGVMGEGEETFLDLMHYFSNTGFYLKPNNLKNIKGLTFRENGNLIVTPPREPILPLDAIPFPYRSKKEDTYLFSSRGCPYRCTFCASSAFWKKIRFFSAEYVVGEIETLINVFPDLRHIPIWDDLFIANATRFREIVNLIDEKGINRRISFNLSVRSSLVDEELCELFKKMNVTSVAFGAESGSNRILKILNKGVTVEMNQNAINTLHRHRILVGCSFIVGCPTETEEEVRSTYEFILKNIKDGKMSPYCAVNILMPMPGTQIWDDAVNSGIINTENLDWKRLSVWASYRNSNFDNFKEWVQCRQRNNSIYLAEDTLPQERLYEIMYEYEEIIKDLETNKYVLQWGSNVVLRMKTVDRIFPMGTIRRKLAKATYFLFFDWNEFKQRTKRAFYLWRQGGLRAIFSKANCKSPFPLPESVLAHKYCVGKGLEIGGSEHNPFGLNSVNVDFTDSMYTRFKKEEIRLCGKALKVDIVAPGDDIPLPNESQDFIVSSHVIEHFPNPIKALIEWDRLVRPGGIIFMIVPHKERTFDKVRENTPLEHLIEDFKNNTTTRHGDPNDHDHCWITDGFVELINYMIEEYHMKWEIVEVQETDDKIGDGFTVVIRKIGTRDTKIVA